MAGRSSDREGSRYPGPLDPGAEFLTKVERKVAERKRERQRKRRIRIIGVVMMVWAVLIALTHLLAHLEVFGGQPSGLTDLLVGYPTAGILLLLGAILAGQ